MALISCLENLGIFLKEWCSRNISKSFSWFYNAGQVSCLIEHSSHFFQKDLSLFCQFSWQSLLYNCALLGKACTNQQFLSFPYYMIKNITKVQFKLICLILHPPLSSFKIKDWTSLAKLMHVSRYTVSPISKLALSEVVH